MRVRALGKGHEARDGAGPCGATAHACGGAGRVGRGSGEFEVGVKERVPGFR